MAFNSSPLEHPEQSGNSHSTSSWADIAQLAYPVYRDYLAPFVPTAVQAAGSLSRFVPNFSIVGEGSGGNTQASSLPAAINNLGQRIGETLNVGSATSYLQQLQPYAGAWNLGRQAGDVLGPRIGDAIGEAMQPREGARLFDRSQVRSVHRVLENGRLGEQITLTADQPLPAGDYEITFNNNRAFRMFIPETNQCGPQRDLPVMFVLPGCSSGTENPRDYVRELGMTEQAARHGFIVVTALPQRHQIGPSSETQADAWTSHGIMRPREIVNGLVQQNRYDDVHYIQGLHALVGQIAPATTDPQRRVHVGTSQGAAFLSRLAGDPRFADGTFRNIYLIAGTVESGTADHPVAPYNLRPGNGQRLVVVTPGNDSVLGTRPSQRNQWMQENVVRPQVVRRGLGDIDNEHQNIHGILPLYMQLPHGQVELARQLGPSTDYTVSAFGVPANGNPNSDFSVPLADLAAMNLYTANRARERRDNPQAPAPNVRFHITRNDGRQCDLYHLPQAGHGTVGMRTGFNIPTHLGNLFAADLEAYQAQQQHR